MKMIMDHAATIIQCVVRRMLAMNKLELMRIEEQIMNYLALFLQSRFRGIKARQRVQFIRQQLAQKQKEEMASIRIQNFQRCRVAKRLLAEAREVLEVKKVRAACLIQARVRGILARKIFLSLKQHHAAVIIQCMARVTMARQIVGKRKWALQQEMKKAATPKRVPLYKKTYSIYSVDVRKRDTSEISPTEEATLESNEIVSATLENVSKDQRQHWKSRKRESSEKSLDEKVILAQQRASMRVAKLKVLERIAKEKEEEQATLRKKELDRLETQRRVIMAQEEENRRKLQSEKSSNAIKEIATEASACAEKTQPLAQSVEVPSVNKSCTKAPNEHRSTAQIHNHKGGGRTRGRNHSKNESVKKIKIMDLSYCWDDGDFEEDTCEDENDLSSQS
jgi:IQ calmodulin-binding motif.